MLNYESLGTVGEGTYGLVIKARHRETGQVVAIKKFKESDDDEQVRKTALREVRILKQLRHDNVVNLLEVFRRKGKLYLVFEYVDRTILQDLERYPDGMDPRSVKQLLYQLLRAMEFCHRHNVIHRDVKPENMLISKNGALKLCDFGFARNLAGPGAKYTEYVSTRWYRAPELLVGDTQYGKAIDIWSVGCLVAEMLTGQPLFPGDSDIDQLFQIMECCGTLTPRFVEVFNANPLFEGIQIPEIDERNVVTLEERFPDMDPQVLDLMKQCLRYEPRARPTCEDLLQHPYFDGFAAEFDDELKEIIAKDWSELPSRKRKKREGKHRRNASDSTGHFSLSSSKTGGAGAGGGDDTLLSSRKHGSNSSLVNAGSSTSTATGPQKTTEAQQYLTPTNDAQADSMRGSDMYGTSDGATTTDSQRHDSQRDERLPSLRSKTPVATRLTALPSLNAEVDDSDSGHPVPMTTHSRKKKNNYMPSLVGGGYSHHLQFGVGGNTLAVSGGGSNKTSGKDKAGGSGMGPGEDSGTSLNSSGPIKMAGTGLTPTMSKAHQLQNSVTGVSRKKSHRDNGGFGARTNALGVGHVDFGMGSKGVSSSRGNNVNYNMHLSFAGKPPNYSFTGLYSKYRKPLGYNSNHHGR